MSFFEDEELFTPELTKGVVVCDAEPLWLEERMYRGVAVAAPGASVEAAVLPKASVMASVEAPVALPPPVPASPFFLERTHVRSTAPAAQVWSCLKRILAALPTSSMSSNDSKFKVRFPRAPAPLRPAPRLTLFLASPASLQITFETVRECVGVEAAVRLYTEASGAVVVEFQCMQSRGRAQFIALYNEVVTALVAAGVVPAEALKSLPHVMRSLPLALPACLAPKVDVSPATLEPLHSMVQSECGLTRREGLAVLASLAACASPASANDMVKAGTLSLLRDTAKEVTTDFEARANCQSAINALQCV